MKKLIKERHLIPLGVWFVVYMGLFLYLEVFEPDQVHLIVSELVSLYYSRIVSRGQKSDRPGIQKSGSDPDYGHESLSADLLCVAHGAGSEGRNRL